MHYIISHDKWLKKSKLDNDDTKTFRLIKEYDLQLYEGVASSPNCKSQTEEESFEY